MDRITAQAANDGLAHLVENGGGTYEGGTLLPFTPAHGFAVGIGGVTLPEANVNVETFVWACRMAATEYEASFVGTWLDEGTVFFDAVVYFDDREAAIAAGFKHGQKAIYDFGLKAAVEL